MVPKGAFISLSRTHLRNDASHLGRRKEEGGRKLFRGEKGEDLLRMRRTVRTAGGKNLASSAALPSLPPGAMYSRRQKSSGMFPSLDSAPFLLLGPVLDPSFLPHIVCPLPN